MSSKALPVVRTTDDLTPEWLGAVLGRRSVTIDSIEQIGTGQMSQSYRVRFRAGDGEPASVVVKLASADPGSRATGVTLGAYRREICFYRGLAERIDVALATCHHAEYDDAEGWFTLVLDDVRDAAPGDQIAGCTVEQARIAARTLARLQAPVLGDLHVGTADYLNQPNPLTQQLAAALLPGFLERYAGRIAPEHVEVCRRFVGVLDAWAADQRPPLGLVHGDFRLDNLLFSDGACTVVDWQTVSWGPALYDLSYFLAGALDPAERRAHEEELVRLYRDELVAQGAQPSPGSSAGRSTAA